MCFLQVLDCTEMCLGQNVINYKDYFLLKNTLENDFARTNVPGCHQMSPHSRLSNQFERCAHAAMCGPVQLLVLPGHTFSILIVIKLL
jgi:hypothetical protein